MSIDFDHITIGSLYPILDHVIVSEIEAENERKTKSGIIIPSETGSERGIRPRWAFVHAVGPDQIDVKPNTWVLVDHGRWTRGVKFDDGKVYRKVDPKDILLESSEKLF